MGKEQDPTMRTTTVRVDSDLLFLAQEAAGIEDVGTAEFIRRCIRTGVQTIARDNPEFRQTWERVYTERLEAEKTRIEQTLGLSPTTSEQIQQP